MYKLDEVTTYIQDEMNQNLTSERIKRLYNMIDNHSVRVNNNDKKWVAFVSQASENQTVVDAMKEILENVVKNFDWELLKDFVIETIDDVGEIFVSKNIKLKPRIPFYVLTLDRIKKEENGQLQ